MKRVRGTVNRGREKVKVSFGEQAIKKIDGIAKRSGFGRAVVVRALCESAFQLLGVK